MQVEQTTLKNKLKTLFIHNSGSNSASVQIWFRAGSALENSSNQGIAHFLEHMFFKGTKKRPGAAIAKAVESFGGEINAFTSFDYTCYYINTPITHLDETVDILMDMVANPLFTESELIPEREVVFEEYRRSIDNPSQFAFKELQKSCFQAGYAHPILGTEKTIKNFSRKQLTDFRNKFYNLSNAMLIVAGDLKHKNKLIQIIQKYKLPAGTASKFGEFKLKNKSTINIHNKEVRQGVLTLTIPAFNYHHNKTPSEDLAINCLAHGESSRFYTELVHNSSLCSTVSGSTMYFQNGGAHFLRFVFPEKNLEQILQKTSEILHEARKSGYSSSEVNKIKNQYVSSKIYEKESIEAFSFSMGHGFAQTGNIHCETEFIDKIKGAKTQEVNHSLIEIFDRQPHLCLQLPKSENKNNYKPILEKFVKALKRETKLEKTSHHLKFEKSKHDPQVKVFTLKNGIKFIYRQNTMTPTFVFHAYMKGGISLETKENNGIYHLITQVQTMGHSGIDYDQIKLELENKSASLNGFSGKNALGLTMHGQTEHSEELFGHFFGTLLRPDFPEKFIQHEKEIVYRVLENQKEDPVKQCFKKFNGYLFNGHAYGFDAIGSK
jgi:zinc protease